MNTYIMRALNALGRTEGITSITIPSSPDCRMWASRDGEYDIRGGMVNKAKRLVENTPYTILELRISAMTGIEALVSTTLQELIRHNVEATFEPDSNAQATFAVWKERGITYKTCFFWDRA